MGDVLAFAEQRDGQIRKVANEMVTAARTLAAESGGEVHALAVGGGGLAERAGSLGAFGAARVRVAEHEALARYSPEGYTDAVVQAVEGGDYDAVLFPATSLGKDLAPRVAARLDVPLASDVTGLGVDGGSVSARRPIYAGKAFADLVMDARPALLSVRPNTFQPSETEGGSAEVETFTPRVDPGGWGARVMDVETGGDGELDVAEASVVVSGGRGMGDPENWHLLEELRDAVGSAAALGASRAVVDAGWRPHAEQVGQTGKTVSPRLYFAIGISGAIQHLAGMRTASTIVAVNKDPDAPIFDVADYGIVGDLFEILPKLTEAIRALRSEG